MRLRSARLETFEFDIGSPQVPLKQASLQGSRTLVTAGHAAASSCSAPSPNSCSSLSAPSTSGVRASSTSGGAARVPLAAMKKVSDADAE
eukprot:1972990-Rhodomonas_salina.1